jgi:hypothetical protein
MMKPAWGLPIAVVLVASAVPLAQVLRDRGGERGTLTLSHKELMVEWRDFDENSGVLLGWRWLTPPTLDSVPEPFVQELGIKCPRDRYSCDFRGRRRAWIVVALEDAEWQRTRDTAQARLDSALALPESDSTRRSQVYSARDRLEYIDLYTSRLKMVGVGTDPAALAAEWEGRPHLVLAARLRAYRTGGPRDTVGGLGPLYNIHADPLPRQLYVPQQMAREIEDSSGTDRAKFEVTVTIGRSWLPRVDRVVGQGVVPLPPE